METVQAKRSAFRLRLAVTLAVTAVETVAFFFIFPKTWVQFSMSSAAGMFIGWLIGLYIDSKRKSKPMDAASKATDN